MYRWRDADGTVHIESAPPTTGIEFQTITFQKTANRQAGETPAGTNADTPDAPSPPTHSPLEVYTPDGMKALMRRWTRSPVNSRAEKNSWRSWRSSYEFEVGLFTVCSFNASLFFWLGRNLLSATPASL